MTFNFTFFWWECRRILRLGRSPHTHCWSWWIRGLLDSTCVDGFHVSGGIPCAASGDVRVFPSGTTGGRTAMTSWCRRTFRGDVLVCVELSYRVYCSFGHSSATGLVRCRYQLRRRLLTLRWLWTVDDYTWISHPFVSCCSTSHHRIWLTILLCYFERVASVRNNGDVKLWQLLVTCSKSLTSSLRSVVYFLYYYCCALLPWFYIIHFCSIRHFLCYRTISHILPHTHADSYHNKILLYTFGRQNPAGYDISGDPVDVRPVHLGVRSVARWSLFA